MGIRLSSSKCGDSHHPNRNHLRCPLPVIRVSACLSMVNKWPGFLSKHHLLFIRSSSTTNLPGTSSVNQYRKCHSHSLKCSTHNRLSPRVCKAWAILVAHQPVIQACNDLCTL